MGAALVPAALDPAGAPSIENATWGTIKSALSSAYAGGSQSSNRLPSGSIAHPKRPYSDS